MSPLVQVGRTSAVIRFTATTCLAATRRLVNQSQARGVYLSGGGGYRFG